MQKLLSLLSVLTISGAAIPTTIAASSYQKEEQIINREKRQIQISPEPNVNFGGINVKINLARAEVVDIYGKLIANASDKSILDRFKQVNTNIPHNWKLETYGKNKKARITNIGLKKDFGQSGFKAVVVASR